MGEPFDESCFERDPLDGVIHMVRKQAEVGVDVPSDGEYGKSSGWATYGSGFPASN
jgi:5-methyltetrahydropteroyltriglutamate--homocysteine methyltransferase